MTIKTDTIRIPRRFYDDHCERDLPAPSIIKTTKAHYWIDAHSESLAELLSDAEYYEDSAQHMEREMIGIIRSAAATASAIRAAS